MCTALNFLGFAFAFLSSFLIAYLAALKCNHNYYFHVSEQRHHIWIVNPNHYQLVNIHVVFSHLVVYEHCKGRVWGKRFIYIALRHLLVVFWLFCWALLFYFQMFSDWLWSRISDLSEIIYVVTYSMAIAGSHSSMSPIGDRSTSMARSCTRHLWFIPQTHSGETIII